MGLGQKILDLLGEKEIELEPEEAVDVFSKERKKGIEKTRKREDELRENTKEVLENLADELNEMEDFDDSDIQAVKDVAANFSAERRRMAERLQPEEKFPDHAEDFLEFRKKFNDVSEKEAEVLKRVKGKSGDLPDALKKFEDHGETLEGFIESGRDVLETQSQLEDKVKELKDMRHRKAEIEEELQDIDIEDLRDRKDKIEEELEELKQSEEWVERTQMEDKIHNIQDEKDSKLSDLSGTASGIERSLRKVIYHVEEDEGDFKGNIEDLRNLSDQEFSEVDSPGESLQAALEIIEDKDLVSDRQRDRFRDSIEKLSNLDEVKEEINSKEKQIRNLEGKLDDMEVIDRKEELEDQIGRLRSRIEARQDRKQEIKDQLSDIRSDENDLIEDIAEMLEDNLGIQVTMEA